MNTAAEWLALAEKARKAKGPDREIDKAVNKLALGVSSLTPLTRSLDAIVALTEKMLPGWMKRVQWCGISAEAWIAPDLNNPDCGRLFRNNPGHWHDYAERNEIEIQPGSKQAAINAMVAAFCKAQADVLAAQAREKDNGTV